MINPLEAMMAARAANQGNAYGAGVQNTGAVNPEVLLAMQRMNTPTIGQRMDGQNSQMVAVDPYKYANLKQQRDYEAAMNARTNNTKMQVANANALNQQFLANQLYDRNLERDDTAFSRSQELAQTENENRLAQIQQQADLENTNNINAEARELRDLEKKQTIIQNGQKALMALKNEQFGPELRTQAGQAIQTQMRWNSGGKEETTQAYSTEAINQEALTLGEQAIQAEYIAQQKAKGIENPVELKRTDGKGKINPVYQQVANDALMKAPDIAERITKIQREVAKRVSNTETMINQSANTSLQLINKQGVSPLVDPDFEPTFTNPFTPDIQTSGLPLPPANAGANPIGTSELDLDTSTSQLQESAGEIESKKALYDSLMMQIGGIGARNEAQVASESNPLTNFGRNAIWDGFGNASADYIGGEDSEIMDALKYAGVDSDDALMFTNDLDDLSGPDIFSSEVDRHEHIKAELDRRIAVLQEALANSQNSE